MISEECNLPVLRNYFLDVLLPVVPLSTSLISSLSNTIGLPLNSNIGIRGGVSDVLVVEFLFVNDWLASCYNFLLDQVGTSIVVVPIVHHVLPIVSFSKIIVILCFV